MTTTTIAADQSAPNGFGAGNIHTAVLALVPGAVQGAASIVIGHPFDTLKTRLQARSSGTQLGLLQVARTMLHDEGILAFYRGVSPPLLITSTKRSLQLSVWEFLKHLPEASDSTSLQGRLRPLVVSPFGAGAIAGAFGTTLGCPMNVIKIQTQNVRREDTRNALTCIVRIARDDGLLGFYRGLHMQLLKDTTFAATYLGLYDLVLTTVERHSPPSEDGGPQHRRSSTFAAGLVASMSTWTLLFPLDTAKTFVQARQPLRDLWRELTATSLLRGISRLYKGLPAALLRAGPVAGVTMVLYEYVKEAMGLSYLKRGLSQT